MCILLNICIFRMHRRFMSAFISPALSREAFFKAFSPNSGNSTLNPQIIHASGPDPCVCCRNQQAWGKKSSLSTESPGGHVPQASVPVFKTYFFPAKPNHRFETAAWTRHCCTSRLGLVPSRGRYPSGHRKLAARITIETIGFSKAWDRIWGFKSAKIVTDRTQIGRSWVVRVRKRSISFRFLSSNSQARTSTWMVSWNVQLM